MLLSDAIATFIVGYFSVVPRSKKTLAAYRADLRQFAVLLGVDKRLSELTSSDIESWALCLRDMRYAPASLQRKISLVRTFLNYWVRKAIIPFSPFIHLRVDTGRQTSLPKVLSIDETIRLLQAARTMEYPKCATTVLLALRNHAIIELMITTGLRVGEVSALALKDVKLDDYSLNVCGKGNRERLAYLADDDTRRAMIAYINHRNSLSTTSPHLFLNLRRYRISTQGIANIVKRTAEYANIERKVTPHMLRHTAATLLLRNGADIRIVQEFLGHSSITMTQRYTHVSQQYLREQLAARHPKLALGHRATAPRDSSM
jgi:site-specific recombinase XerD